MEKILHINDKTKKKKYNKKKESVEMKNIFKKDKRKTFLFFVPFILVTIGLFTTLEKEKEKSYKEFSSMVESSQVKEAYIDFDSETFKFEDYNGESWKTDNPKTDNFKEYLLENDVEIKINKTSAYIGALLGVFPIIMMSTLLLLMINKMGLKALNKKNSLVSFKPDTNFASIAGNEGAKEEMKYLVNFLKSPESYHEMGAKLPKGVVLYGPPGTGKTLTAKAIAGEAQVPFYSIAGSDFIEMYAGLGAKRVRELYSDARNNSPCIVFIDEIDAIGTHRGADRSGNGEKDQTINALLAELDGFSPSKPIVTIVATNRVEDLDTALIRPGRFDKHIAINLPDKEDRLKIFNVHSANKKLAKDVNLKEIADITIGFSGAAIEALMNEAAILAVNDGASEISHTHIDEAYYKMLVGGHKKKVDRKDMDKLTLVAYHEAGHALSASLLTENKIPKVSIIPSTTGMGGMTFNIPKNTGLLTKNEILNNIKVLYAGRAAEYILRGDYGETTTGASQDIKQATVYLNQYFANYGMSSEFGLVELKDDKDYLKESISLSKQLYSEVLTLLQENESKLKKIANALIEKETIGEKELNKLMEED